MNTLRTVAPLLACLALLGACDKPGAQEQPKVPGTASAPAASPAPAEAGTPKELRVYMWSEYIDPALLEDFQAATGVRVIVDAYEDTETMIAKLQHQEGDKLYDLVVVSDHAVPVLARLGKIRPLDRSRVPNLSNVSELFRTPPYDPEGVFSAPYQWGTVGLIYRTDAVPAGPVSWSLVLGPEPKVPFVLIDSMRDMLGVALKASGKSVNETDAGAVRAAGESVLAAKARKQCLGFEGGVGGKNKVAGGMAGVAVCYSGDALRAIAEDPALAYAIPVEGTIVWVDAMAVTARAQNPGAAHALVNFLLDADNGAKLSNWTRFASPNEAAMPTIRAEDRSNPAVYPPADVYAKLEYIRDVGEATALYDEVWTSVKAR
jgi:spermidine/putrescine transport system substrate-binding protein